MKVYLFQRGNAPWADLAPPNDGAKVDKVIEVRDRADAALYAAKAEGRVRAVFDRIAKDMQPPASVVAPSATSFKSRMKWLFTGK